MSLIGKIVRITSDNESYNEWFNRNLIITDAYKDTDDEAFPDLLCDLRDIETGEDCPFSLYEYEFD
jgi:hypothetical protein